MESYTKLYVYNHISSACESEGFTSPKPDPVSLWEHHVTLAWKKQKETRSSTAFQINLIQSNSLQSPTLWKETDLAVHTITENNGNWIYWV